MDSNYTTRIETVIVEVNGQEIDCVSFASSPQAENYKRGVRQWAIERGLLTRVYSRVMDVTRKESANRTPAAGPALALAS
jgi:hypothetical protein